MKKTLLLLLILAFSVPVMADDKSHEKPGGALLGAATVTATVEDIDYKTRNITLRGPEGKTTSFKVGPLAHNFDQIKKNDKVTFKYMEALALDVQPATGDLGKSADLSIERAPKGSKPAGIVTETVTIKAAVESIDHKNRKVTLIGPEGRALTLKVGEQAKRFNEIKTGDQVVVLYTEALGISVQTPQG